MGQIMHGFNCRNPWNIMLYSYVDGFVEDDKNKSRKGNANLAC